jgi:hypothetical protein
MIWYNYRICIFMRMYMYNRYMRILYVTHYIIILSGHSSWRHEKIALGFPSHVWLRQGIAASFTHEWNSWSCYVMLPLHGNSNTRILIFLVGAKLVVVGELAVLVSARLIVSKMIQLISSFRGGLNTWHFTRKECSFFRMSCFRNAGEMWRHVRWY